MNLFPRPCPGRPGTSRAPSWPLVRALLCLGAYLAAAALVWSQTPGGRPSRSDKPASDARSDQPPSPKIGQRVREGTELVDLRGVFKKAGQRVHFLPNDGQGPFVALENLNLQRIARTIADSLSRQEWEVSGTVTEYRGANFLLVKKAVLRQPTEALAGTR